MSRIPITSDADPFTTSIAECVGQKLPSVKRTPSNRSHHPQQNGNFTLTGRTAPDFTASRFVGQSCGLGSGVRPTHFFISFFRCAPRGAGSQSRFSGLAGDIRHHCSTVSQPATQSRPTSMRSVLGV